MAYTPINWQTGDTITAEKMNKMDNGWSVTTTSNYLFNETVECEYFSGDNYGGGELAYTTLLTEPSLVITFDGIDYTCAIQEGDGFNIYGGAYDPENDTVDFTTYPFSLMSGPDSNLLMDEAGGTHTIAVGGSVTIAEISDAFATASQTAVTGVLPLKIEFGITTLQEAYDALQAGRTIYVIPSNNSRIEPVIFVDRVNNYSIVCVSYASGNLTTRTYYAYPSSADSPIVEN